MTILHALQDTESLSWFIKADIRNRYSGYKGDGGVCGDVSGKTIQKIIK